MTLAELMLNDLTTQAVEAYRQSVSGGKPRPDAWIARDEHQQAMRAAVAAVLKGLVPYT